LAKIQNRIIKDEETLQKLTQLSRKQVINYHLANTGAELHLVNQIFERQLNARHDWQIYNVYTQDRKKFAAFLIKRGSLDEDEYFKPDILERNLRQGMNMQQVLADPNTINYCVTATLEAFNRGIEILVRSMEYCSEPEKLRLVQIMNLQGFYGVILTRQIYEDFFE
jgi:DNA-binding transcriptional regulator WhiA